MSKSKPKIDKAAQLNIFDLIQTLAQSPADTQGQFKVVEQLRRAIREAIKASTLSRHQIAGEMSHLIGETITKEMLDTWTRESDEINGRPARHIPGEFLPAFCKVTGDNEPLAVLGRLVGLFVLPGPEALRAEIQRLDETIKAAQCNKKKRLLFLKEMEK